MLLRDAPGPGAGEQKLQRLRLADASEGIAQNRLDQLKNPQCNGPVGLYPVTQVGSELRMEDRLPFTASAQFSSHGAACRAAPACPILFRHAGRREEGDLHSWANGANGRFP